MSPTNRARFLLFILLFQLPDAVLTTLPLLASHSHQVIVCVNRSFQTFSNTSMRRNFPRPYTTTYLRVVVVGQLVALADSEITAFLPVVLTGFVTVSFHSIRVAVSFDAVSVQFSPCLRSSQPCLPMLHQFLPTCRDCLCASLGVGGRLRTRTAGSSQALRRISPYSKLPACPIVTGFFLPCIVVIIF